MRKEVALIVVLLLVTVIPVYRQGDSTSVAPSGQGELINITAQEAWEMLNNEEDGIQIPVDVRTLEDRFRLT